MDGMRMVPDSRHQVRPTALLAVVWTHRRHWTRREIWNCGLRRRNRCRSTADAATTSSLEQVDLAWRAGRVPDFSSQPGLERSTPLALLRIDSRCESERTR